MRTNRYLPRLLFEDGLGYTIQNGLCVAGATIWGRLDYQRQKRRYGGATPRIYNVIHVDPREIKYMVVPSFSNTKSVFSTYIEPGEWDRRTATTSCVNPAWLRRDISERKLVRFENYLFYDGAREYLLEGVPWTETEYYRRYRAGALASTRGRYSDPDGKLARKRRRLERLYETIKTNGYKSQRELSAEDSDLNDGLPFFPPEYHEIRVVIGRNGAVFFDDGHHRMIVAKLLGLDRIPVRVIARHQLWQAVRSEIHTAVSSTELGETARRHLDHPDLQDVR